MKIGQAGRAERDTPVSVCRAVFAKESLADGTSWRIYDIDELVEKIHFFDCLINSSKEPSGLIPGHASFVNSQASLSLMIAG